MKTKLYILLFLSCLGQTSFGQLTANAGSPRFLCVGTSTTLGGAPTASGGTPPYTYLWQPSTFLSSTTVPNPIAISCNADVLYILKVIDAAGDTAAVKKLAAYIETLPAPSAPQKPSIWPPIFDFAKLAFIPPLLLLALGYIGLWVGRGFKRSNADEK